MKKLFFVFSVLISFGVSAGEIYTCTVNGKTVYQGKPCAGKELSEKIKQSQAKLKDSKLLQKKKELNGLQEKSRTLE